MNCTNKNELCNQKISDQPENSGVMSLARWFRELRGKSSGKESAGVENSWAKNSKTKDERRVKLNRTNSALPTNFRKNAIDEDVVDGPGTCSGGGGGKRERKIKGVDKRRYSFNGNSNNAKLARNPRNYLVETRRNFNRQTDEFQSYSSPYKTGVVESTISPYKESQSMIGGELRKSRASVEHKLANSTATHVSAASAKGFYNNYTNFDDPAAVLNNFDSRNNNSNAAPPLPPLRGASSLLAGRYISSTIGHEKYPSWPSSDLTECCYNSTTTTTTTDEQLLQNGNHAKETRSAVVKPQMSQLKPVIENREGPTTTSQHATNGIDVTILEPSKAIDDEARSREKVYMRHLECERIFADDEDNAPCPPDRDISLAKSGHLLNTAAAAAYHHQYSHSHQDSSYMSQDGDYAECYVDEGRTLLTKAELEQYTKDYEEGIVKSSHQKQPSYAQSEGYHSYVSSNDSAIITPLLDRLRRENDVIISAEENSIVADRESSASSGSSSDTLKWHGSLSDVSVASSSYRASGTTTSNSRHIAHSARVQTPQRHHSESVLYLDAVTATCAAAAAAAAASQHPRGEKANQMNSQMRKLFPVNTYSVHPASPRPVSSMANATAANLNDNSPTSPKMTVAERINALERQQQQQQQPACTQPSTKYIYFDPEKKHKVSGQDLKVMQKKALLLYYERHHSSWRSEPQLSPISSPLLQQQQPLPPPPPPPPHRPRLPTPTSRRSSSASDYQDSINKEGVSNCNNDCDVTSVPSGYTHQNEPKVHNQYSSSCGSLFPSEMGPMIVGEPISVDDWVPALPPKKAHLRASFASRHISSPDLPPPSPPPVVDDEVFISDEPLPPPPPEIIASPSATTTKCGGGGGGGDETKPMATAPDLILSAATPSLDSRNNNCAINSRLDEQRPTMTAIKRTPSKMRSGDFSRYSQHLYQDEVLTAEYKNQFVEADKARLGTTLGGAARSTPSPSSIAPSRTQNSQFLAKRSVFADGFAERHSVRYSSTHKQQPNGGKSSSSTTRGVADGDEQSSPRIELTKRAATNGGGSHHEVNVNGFPPYGFESKSTKVESKYGKSAQFAAVLRHSEKFPAMLDPQCPPTSYQLSRSSYRRESTMERERAGQANYEGGSKRTVSNNGFANGYCPKDIENVDSKSRMRGELSATSTTTAMSTTITHSSTAVSVSTTVAVATPVAPVAVHCASHTTCRELFQNTTTAMDGASLASVRLEQPPTIDESPSVVSTVNQQKYSAKTLPLAAAAAVTTGTAVADKENSLGEPTKQRSCRTPRTQSDPSSVKDTVSSTANLLASHSSTNLQKTVASDTPPSPLSTLVVCGGIPRSQSDLSNVGSTESGYSSLSLNVPSPSVSPTRLSSTSSASSSCSSASGGGHHPNATAMIAVTSWSCSAGVQCDMVNAEVAAATPSSMIVRDLGHKMTPAVDSQCCKYSQKSEIVLRINAVTNDAASQTEGFADRVEATEELSKKENETDAVLVKAVPAACLQDCGGSGTSPSPIIFKRKLLQDEIDCERLSHELISHLSYDDRLYKILAPKTNFIKSTDYLTNLFKTMTASFSEYSSCCTQFDNISRLHNRNTISSNEQSYQNETTTCRLQDNKICDNVQRVQPLTTHQMRQKMEKLIDHLNRRINVLRAEQTTIAEKCCLNDTLGETISDKVSKVVSAQEAAKYKLHIQEIGHITSLLLGLSVRLAKVENSLQELAADNQAEKKFLESKRDKLICQLKEAKMLKTNIDKRGFAVSALLVKHFTDEELAEYEYFVHMKSKLLVDSREIAEKIEHTEQQLTALKNSADDEKF